MADVRGLRDLLASSADTVRARIARGLGLRAIQQLGLPPDLARWEGDAVPQELFIESLYRALVPVRSDPALPTLAFVNGRWYDGGRFEARTMYSVAGVLRDAAPARIDRTVDLAGGFVVPPFGEAHTHRLSDPATLDADRRAFIEAGVFYAMVQDPITDITAAHRTGGPDAPDVAYTQGVITPSDGTIARMYGMMAQSGRFGAGVTVADLDGRLLFRLDSPADVQARWPEIERLNDRFIKVILAFTDERERRIADPARYGMALPAGTALPGLREEVVRALVARAHAAGIGVSAHVETAADVRAAIRAGVDWIAHLPASWQIGEGTGYAADEQEPWQLEPADAGALRRARIPVSTTISRSDPDHPRAALFDAVHRHNLTVLEGVGAALAIGSDRFDGTSVDEVLHLRGYGVYDDAQLLSLLAVQTPRLIFPERRIGHLRPGFEASFLVLGGDPLTDLARVRDIRVRVLRGVVLDGS